MALLDIKIKGCEAIENTMGILDNVVFDGGIEYDYVQGIEHSCIKKDFLKLADKYYQNRYYDSKKPYSDDALAVALVAEVLDHHNISYDLKEMLSFFDVTLTLFDFLNHDIRLWSKNHYWRNCMEYWNRKWKTQMTHNVQMKNI